MVNFNELVAIFVAIFIMNSTTQNTTNSGDFHHVHESQNQYLLVNPTIQETIGCSWSGRESETVMILDIFPDFPRPREMGRSSFSTRGTDVTGKPTSQPALELMRIFPDFSAIFTHFSGLF